MRVSIGQDSHKFELKKTNKKLVIGGIEVKDEIALLGNSDADVVLHAITNAVSGITCVNILGKKTDEMCKNGVLDSEEYLKESLKYLADKIVHLSISIECLKPKITPLIDDMRINIGRILNVKQSQIGITATTGEGLTNVGQGKGISVFCVLTVE